MASREKEKLPKKRLLEDKNRAAAEDDGLPRHSWSLDIHKVGALVPPFDPDDKDANVIAWLTKVEQLGDVYGWKEGEKICIVHMKLEGLARRWFQSLQSYDMSWLEWKELLERAFFRQNDFAILLEEMVGRVKVPGETFANYFQEKLAMCDRIQIRGERATSCIIHGLPLHLKEDANALRCQQPETLYTDFLSHLDDIEGSKNGGRPVAKAVRKQAVSKPNSRGGRELEVATVPSISAGGAGGQQLVRCYNCQKMTTHMARNCPEPRQERCKRCQVSGHKVETCPKKMKVERTGEPS